ncbi:unnamed protein product [Toxocara canis]|uniref:DDE Tnp4 domain-containing protein n=1 Tax=Toxocara canis TaxID=6265 RepID=A0A183U2L3_TOXCA|nr:unnamed protein product [Toxocara canis]
MCYKDVECAIAGTSCAGRIFYPEMDDIALNANVLGCVDQNLRYRFAENTPTPIKHKEDKDVEKSTRTDRNRERRTLNVRIAEGKVLLNCFWSKSRSRSGDSSCSI